MADYGFGNYAVPALQEGGSNSLGASFEGLGRRVIEGCTTISDPTKPMLDHKQEVDEKGKILGKVTIDKTRALDFVVDTIHASVPDPTDPKIVYPKLTFLTKHDYEVDGMFNDCQMLTRADLEQDQNATKEDPRQHIQKLWNHPPDHVMALAYALQASKKYDPDAYKIFPVGRRGPHSGFRRFGITSRRY